MVHVKQFARCFNVYLLWDLIEFYEIKDLNWNWLGFIRNYVLKLIKSLHLMSLFYLRGVINVLSKIEIIPILGSVN